MSQTAYAAASMEDTPFLPRESLQALFDVLNSDGFRTLGPVVKEGAIQYVDLVDAKQLPGGWRDAQAPGSYRLRQTGSERCFAWANGPQALKPWLFSAREVLWESQRREAAGLDFSAHPAQQRPLALIGARACDLAALQLQDRHFLAGIEDPYYAARRRGLFVVAVHCTQSADTCFCASTGDGPRATAGFDLALSESDGGFLIEIGSEPGRSVAARLPLETAPEGVAHAAKQEITAAARAQQRRLPSQNLRDTLFARLNAAHWEQVAERCLACGNCTSVCPTCFCHAEVDQPELDGTSSRHLREWDSCFSEGHSYLHGFVVRPDTRHRYRQWLTHKLGSWHDQYGRSGCVGCGRCITWCPVGIDITQETAEICAGDASGVES